MKIVVLLANFGSGGAEDVLIRLANAFSYRRLLHEIVVGHDVGPLRSKVDSSVVIRDLRRPSIKRALLPLVNYIKQENPDVILTSKAHVNVIAILATKIAGRKTKVVIREATTPSMDFDNSLMAKIIRGASKKIYPKADAIVAVSQGVKEDMISYYGFDEKSIDVVYNPLIKPNEFSKFSEVNHKWFNDEHRIILSVGRVVRAKDFMTLLKAFSIVKKSVLCKLVILGETTAGNASSDLYQDLQNFITENKLEDEVDFAGYQSNVKDYMAKAELYVLSSLYEGLPGALIQAVASGCKIVSTDCKSGPSEVLKNGKFGHLVEAGDFESMASRMIDQLKTQDRVDDGLNRASDFHHDINVDRYLELFNRIIKN